MGLRIISSSVNMKTSSYYCQFTKSFEIFITAEVLLVSNQLVELHIDFNIYM